MNGKGDRRRPTLIERTEAYRRYWLTYGGETPPCLVCGSRVLDGGVVYRCADCGFTAKTKKEWVGL